MPFDPLWEDYIEFFCYHPQTLMYNFYDMIRSHNDIYGLYIGIFNLHTILRIQQIIFYIAVFIFIFAYKN